MGVGVSTPRADAKPEEHREHLLGALVGSRAYDLSSSFWQKLLAQQPSNQWSPEREKQAVELLAQNNRDTAHLSKLLIHLVWSLQEMASAPPGVRTSGLKVFNATQFSRVFLKYFIEQSKTIPLVENLALHVSEHEAAVTGLQSGEVDVPCLVLQALLSFIGNSDINPYTYMLHLELVSLLLVMMSSELFFGSSASLKNSHPFLDAAMLQGPAIVSPFVRKLLLSCIARMPLPSEAAYYAALLEGSHTSVIRRMSSAAASVFMLPYYTYTYLLSSSGHSLSKYPLAENSLFLLLVLVHYGKTVSINDDIVLVGNKDDNGKVPQVFMNPYRRALESARDTDFDLVDIEENLHGGSSNVRIPFAALYDVLGLCLKEDTSILLLYSLVHGNPAFLEYVLVRTDLDTLLMPVLEMLYNVPRRSPNQIYMLLIVLLILSQDSSFNASIHKLILPGVAWYKERLLPRVSLGSLMVVILIRTVKFNLSKLKDVFLHTNCLAILANMAPHMHQLNSYAAQRLVSLFDMLARKYNKLADVNVSVPKEEGLEGSDDVPTELHIYTDFLRIVLEIINSILTYALPRNPELVYALLHRQELFQPFRNHPRFYELLDNIYIVLDFFNVRMDDQHLDGEWSVEKVLQIVIANARSWRGEGMKIFTQLRFTYEEELHPEEFFVPYIWQLVVNQSNVGWNLDNITLFQARPTVEHADVYAKYEVPTTPLLDV